MLHGRPCSLHPDLYLAESLSASFKECDWLYWCFNRIDGSCYGANNVREVSILFDVNINFYSHLAQGRQQNVLNRENCWWHANMSSTMDGQLTAVFSLEEQTWHQHLKDQTNRSWRPTVSKIVVSGYGFVFRVERDNLWPLAIAIHLASWDHLDHRVEPSQVLVAQTSSSLSVCSNLGNAYWLPKKIAQGYRHSKKLPSTLKHASVDVKNALFDIFCSFWLFDLLFAWFLLFRFFNKSRVCFCFFLQLLNLFLFWFRLLFDLLLVIFHDFFILLIRCRLLMLCTALHIFGRILHWILCVYLLEGW